MKNMKKHFLLFSFFAVIPIALAYGVSPDWFASKFLGIDMLDTNIAPIQYARSDLCYASLHSGSTAQTLGF